MSVQMVRPILLDLLDRRTDARAVDRDQVLAIANSMADVGQISPIRVRYRQTDERYEIVAGVHRVEACRSLGLEAALPILEARYATEDGQSFADELGIPLGTLRTWAFRAGLTSKARIAEMARVRNTSKSGRPATTEAADAQN